MTISQEAGLTEDDLLESIHQEMAISERKKAYISASFPKALTLQGPPSTLDSIDGWLSANCTPSAKNDRKRLPIYTPYHAPHLYSTEDILRILDSPNSVYCESEFLGPRPRLISPVTGKYYSTSSRREMLESVLHDVLKEPIHWTKVTAGCVEYVAASETHSWTVRTFGPSLAAGSLVSALKTKAKVETTLDDPFASSDTPQAGPTTKEPIAIVGMAGRFPEAMNHDELWKLLEKGIDCHKVIPADRFDQAIYVAKEGKAKNPTGTPYGCFMKEPGMFDARFFNLSPREAEQTDPQQRLLLTTSYEALEMSGFVPNRTPSTKLERIGTYCGQTGDDYREMNASQDIQTYYISGNDRAFGPGRVNHHFKFGGPSMSIDTACSSSAVALNVACTALWARDCDTALVGGMTLLTSADTFCGLSRGHFLNETGNCNTFDDAADGYCRGEAVATVVVKRLSDAQADNDKILAVILATGTNYSAASASITHPHGPTQEVLYRKLLNQAGLHPCDVDYVEMHGTGTQAGDATEMSSVSNVFAPSTPSRSENHPLWLSAVKANVGHGESASGITALIKSLLVLREGIIPPHVGIKSGVMNRTFPDLKQRNIKIALNGEGAFPFRPERKRRVLVNNFGAAGGNTALLLEEAPEKDHHGLVDTRPDHVISVTAKTTTSIRKNIQHLLTYLETEPKICLSDLSYTTTARRMQFPIRISLAASSVGELKELLTSALANEKFKPSAKVSNIIFAFTGQGALDLPLAKQLYESSKQFRSDMIRFNQICHAQGFPSFLSVIDGSASDLDVLPPAVTQLAITAVQIGLSRLWTSWGISPTAVIGHSLGEYAALFSCEVLSANDTLYLVGRRAGILEATCTPKTHCMVSIHSGMAELKQVLGDSLGNLEVACINGPEDVVLSGKTEAAHEVRENLKRLGMKCTILNIPFAFHSAQIDPILDDFGAAAGSVKFMKPKIPLLSPLLGTIIKEAGVVGPSYLRRHAREAVDFQAALRQAESEGLAGKETVWLEIGPNPVCMGMVRSTLGAQIRGMPSLRKNENAWTISAKAMSFLHSAGLDINWNEYHRDFENGQKLIHLPAYSFDEKYYWIEYKNDWALRKGDDVASKSSEIRAEPGMTTTVQRLVLKETKGSTVSLVFETDLSEPIIHAVIAGHSLNGVALCPAGVYADMALTIGDYVRRECKIDTPTTGINITEMEILGPVTVPVPRLALPQLLRITAIADGRDGKVDLEFGTYSPKTKKTDANAKCRIEYGNEKDWLHEWSKTAYLVHKRIQDLERGVCEGTTDKIFKKMAYQLFSALVAYGPKYQGMQEVLVNSDELEANGTVKLYEGLDAGSYFACPLWIDNMAQLSGFVMNAIGIVDPCATVYISHGWGSLQMAMPMNPTKPYQVHVKMQPLDDSVVAGRVSIFQGGTMVGLLGDVRFQRVPRSLLDTMLAPHPSGKDIDRRLSRIAAPTSSTISVSKGISTSKHATVGNSPLSEILRVIAEEVGVLVADLSEDVDFSELGVDSLLSLTILSKIRETLQLDLSPSMFQECPTVKDLRRFLDNSSSTSDEWSDATIETPMHSGCQTPEPLPEPNVTVLDGAVNLLHTTIAEQIGIEVEELLATDDLSALGVDSLMSLSITAALREKLGVDIPLKMVDANFSLKAIEEALNLTRMQPTPIKAPKSQPKPEAKTPGSKTLLLQGNPKSASKTVFLFPDGSGSATSYAELPEIGADTCVLAINSPFLTCPAEFVCRLEEASCFMVAEVRSRQPQGPYILAGWSAGGMYAYEAAKALVEAGETVEKLILIDSPCRLDYGPMPQDVLDYVSKCGVISGRATGTAPQWLVDHFQSTIRAVRDYAPEPFDPSRMPKTFIIWAAKGVFEDWPKAELARLDLTDSVARWLLKPKTDPGSQGWEKLLSPDKISCTTVDGNHFSMVHAPNCNSLSHAIADAIADDSEKRLGMWRNA